MTDPGTGVAIRGVTISAQDIDRSFDLAIPELTLVAGDVVGISGPSGTGKTMLLETLGLLRRPDPGGQFILDPGAGPVDILAMWQSHAWQSQAPALRGQHFGFVPQSGGLLPFLSVANNVSLSQRIANRLDRAWQTELEDMLGLAPLRHLKPAALSIGQRQRVAVARALSHRPSFVIADEPTAALDPENAARAMSLLIEAASIGGAAVVISSHDLDLLDQFSMRRVRLALDQSGDTRSVRSRVSEAMEAA